VRDRWSRDRIERRDAQLRDSVRGKASDDALPGLLDAADVVVDARGTFCPEPVIRLQNAARELAPGSILVLEADDAGVEVDVPAWCMCTGHEYLGVIREPDVYRVLVRLAPAGEST
jgi:TusA-related sulfurtransferase